MDYCTRDDLVDRLSEAGIIYLVDDDGDGSMSLDEQSAVDAAIQAANAEIEAALDGRVPLPLPQINDWLRARAVDLATERLAERKGQAPPAGLAAAARRSRAWLELVRRGAFRVPGIEYLADAEPRLREAGFPRVVNVSRNSGPDESGLFEIH